MSVAGEYISAGGRGRGIIHGLELELACEVD